MFIFLFCFVLWCVQLVASSSFSDITYPSLTVDVNDTILYTLYSLPTEGILYYDEIKVDTPFLLIADLELLTYTPNVPYEFSVINGSSCVQNYDSFLLNVYILPGLTNTTENVTVCMVDRQDLPVAPSFRVPSVETIVNFTINVQDEDDRVGLEDGSLSTFSFYLEDGVTIHPSSRVVFDTVTVDIGSITDCEGLILTPGVEYADNTFCFDNSGNIGLVDIQYYVKDRVGGQSAKGTITFTTRDLYVCEGRTSECTAYGEEELGNGTSLVLIDPLPSSFVSLDAFTYSLVIETGPQHGQLYLYENGILVEVNEGDLIQPNVTNLWYRAFVSYYNRYYFPSFGNGTYSFNNSKGLGLDECEDPVNGCPDSFTYRAISTTNDFYTESELGTFYLVIDRTVVEEMTTCTAYEYSPWYDEPCTSYGEANSYIPVFLVGSDNRDVPDYLIEITSLPAQGDVYYNLQDSNVYIPGELVEVGDIIPLANRYIANLLYAPSIGYYNRLRYDVSPEAYISIVDQYGAYIGNCSDVDACADTIGYKVISGLNSSLESEPGEHRLLVTLTVNDQLTVCGMDGYSPWNVSSCISSGFENSDLDDELQTIAVYLNLNNTNGETVTYVITSKPSFGTMYYNSGNETVLGFGAEVRTGDVILPHANPYFPQMVYVGDPNYFNFVIYEADDALFYGNRNNEPFGSCENALLNGCPDYFGFYANSSTGRRSNPGKYSFFIRSLPSNGTLDGPSGDVLFTPGERYYFKQGSRIRFNHVDKDVYIQLVTITTAEGGLIGSEIDMTNLTFPDLNTCFNTTGCEDTVKFAAYPSDIQRVYDNLFFESNETMYCIATEETTFSVMNRYPDGFTSNDTFTVKKNDSLIAYDTTICSNATDDDDYYANEEDYYGEEQVVAEAQQQNYILGATLGPLAFMICIWLGFNSYQRYVITSKFKGFAESKEFIAYEARITKQTKKRGK